MPCAKGEPNDPVCFKRSGPGLDPDNMFGERRTSDPEVDLAFRPNDGGLSAGVYLAPKEAAHTRITKLGGGHLEIASPNEWAAKGAQPRGGVTQKLSVAGRSAFSRMEVGRYHNNTFPWPSANKKCRGPHLGRTGEGNGIPTCIAWGYNRRVGYERSGEHRGASRQPPPWPNGARGDRPTISSGTATVQGPWYGLIEKLGFLKAQNIGLYG